MEYFEASAKTGYNIDEIFNTACQKIYENINNGIYDEDNDEGVKICNTNSDFEANKNFSLRIQNDNNNYNYEINNSNHSSKRKK